MYICMYFSEQNCMFRYFGWKDFIVLMISPCILVNEKFFKFKNGEYRDGIKSMGGKIGIV